VTEYLRRSTRDTVFPPRSHEPAQNMGRARRSPRSPIEAQGQNGGIRGAGVRRPVGARRHTMAYG